MDEDHKKCIVPTEKSKNIQNILKITFDWIDLHHTLFFNKLLTSLLILLDLNKNYRVYVL